jgi:hypothetical protein
LAESIRTALKDLHGNVSAVARQMGITPRAVQDKDQEARSRCR